MVKTKITIKNFQNFFIIIFLCFLLLELLKKDAIEKIKKIYINFDPKQIYITVKIGQISSGKDFFPSFF